MTTVIWGKWGGWRKGLSGEGTAGSQRWKRERSCVDCSSLHSVASTAAPRFPSTDACSLLSPSEVIPAALPALWTVALGKGKVHEN